ncbi:hypothetical protein [Aureimonas phyllosphaerae]|uniref:Uncharacterized protein n=1 Tax=Aureimonas phyllosphaerae TaxID=1166078 RepID=A0A7W6FWH2_9HYPH|nr:hypothetical protein [Aureimonas phyllosphaerae]MBB3937920.1 hypothetical protein [Aureimonas phyllosphaerae]MBB3961907.1 hypothetical protein [Aureimonas phyllosphaerae]SFF54606.1 hypothetical protein SAMN05216566_12535 [Aureimonas phyllosphaerae]
MTNGLASLPTHNASEAGKKLIGIEHLLQWAYRQELPKVGGGSRSGGIGIAGGWDAVSRFGELGTLVDVSANGFGCVPDLWSDGEAEPHADALAVAASVDRLADMRCEWEEGYDVLSDVEGITDAERAESNRLGFDIARAKGDQLAALVMRVAMIGRAPTWEGHGPVERRVELGPKGQPAWYRLVERSEGEGRAPVMVEMDGFDARRRRPFEGAFQKHYLDPHPAMLAGERLDYQAWVAALAFLSSDLDGCLVAHRVAPSLRRPWPWEDEGVVTFRPRILPVQSPLAGV